MNCIQTIRSVEVEVNHTSALVAKSSIAFFPHTKQSPSPCGFIIPFSPATMNMDTTFHIWPRAPEDKAGINLLLFFINLTCPVPITPLNAISATF